MSVLAVPVENTVHALRRLAPGAVLRSPRDADSGVLLRALRTREPAELASTHPEEVTRVVLTDQLRALARAMTGFFGPVYVGSPLPGSPSSGPGRSAAARPEPARLVRAARYSGPCRFGELPARLRAEPGLRAAALGWAEVAGCRILGAELRGAPLIPAAEDGRRAAELAVAALLPRADRWLGERSPSEPLPGEPAWGGRSAGGPGLRPHWDGGSDGEPLPGEPAPGGQSAGEPGPRPHWDSGSAGEPAPGGQSAGGPGSRPHWDRGSVGEPPPGEPMPESRRNRGLLEVRAVQVCDTGFQVDVDSDPPVDVATGVAGPVLRALWWAGLGRVSDDLGFEYLLLAKDSAGTGTVRHWCHPRPAPGARLLRLESAGYRGERLLLSPASPGTSAEAEVLVRAALMVWLGA